MSVRRHDVRFPFAILKNSAMSYSTGLPRAAHPMTAGVGTHAGAAAWLSLHCWLATHALLGGLSWS